ncbi:hypothetical protein K402DRAFT_78146 [Aulographum hederae CBS 113979]|uniref:Uncharacterized protein n=1 Tax=Aulographum hederae CBS 113979 TaxID=1176131 RepID=A0A6G1HFV6_9PEZI|nr:hypothetical protein K402DRAFT_78146 [Aulographum hederae CBS 113979]
MNTSRDHPPTPAGQALLSLTSMAHNRLSPSLQSSSVPASLLFFSACATIIGTPTSRWLSMELPRCGSHEQDTHGHPWPCTTGPRETKIQLEVTSSSFPLSSAINYSSSIEFTSLFLQVAELSPASVPVKSPFPSVAVALLLAPHRTFLVVQFHIHAFPFNRNSRVFSR